MPRTPARLAAVTVAVALSTVAAPAAGAAPPEGPTLLARAILPADAYQPGPPSGALVTPANGVVPPFPGQPIPGFSAILDAGHGEFWAMPDNGYGAKGNSGDFLLRLYRIAPNLPPSRGFEGMALSKDGKTLYPWLEGALTTDPDPRRRVVNEFDLGSRSYTGRTWSYRVDAEFPGAVIGDVTALDQHRFVLIERGDAQGADARQKKVYLVDLRRVDADGYLVKTLVLDLLAIADPAGISLPARPGEYGVGTAFSFPLQSVESLEVRDGERLLIANDNNYPGSDGRWIARDRPDDTELIIVRAPALR